MYLGKNLSPKEYYQIHSNEYSNPHANGIIHILNDLSSEIDGSVIDLGCGDGLVTKTLSKTKQEFIGIDSSLVMVNRYIKETKHIAYQKEFWEELPSAKIAIASYSLHLSPQSRLASIGTGLQCAGIEKLIIITPIKRHKSILGYNLNELRYKVGPNDKTIYVYL